MPPGAAAVGAALLRQAPKARVSSIGRRGTVRGIMALNSWLTGLLGKSKDATAAKSKQDSPDAAATGPGTPTQGGPEKTIPEDWLRKITELLTPVDTPPMPAQGTSRPGRARDILSFVLTGEPTAILQEVGQNHVVGVRLKTIGYAHTAEDIIAVYKHFDSLPNPIALRWAKLLEASTTGGSRHQVTFHLPLPRGVHWPEALLLHASGKAANVYGHEGGKIQGLSAQKMESLLIEDGLEPNSLLVGAFTPPANQLRWIESRLCTVTLLPGYPDSLQRHLESIRPLVSTADTEQRLLIVKLLQGAHSQTLDALAEPLCEFATSTNKQVRASATAVLKNGGPAVFATLQGIAKHGKPEQRLHALRLIATLATERQDEGQLGFARATASADNAPSVQALIAEWDAASAAAQQAPAYEYEVPRINWDPQANRIPDQALRQFWQEVNASIDKQNAHNRDNYAAHVKQHPGHKLYQIPNYGEPEQQELQAYLESQPHTQPPSNRPMGHHFNLLLEAVKNLANTEGMTPVALFRVLSYFHMFLRNDDWLIWQGFAVISQLRARTGHPTLLELAQIMEDSGISSQRLFNNYCRTWGNSLEDWPPEAVWPYFAHNLELMLRALTQDMGSSYLFDRDRVFRAFALLPALPPTAIDTLFAVALGTAKTDRPAAQEALNRFADKERRIIAALSDGKAETRAVAAQWLGKLRHAPAIEALEAAVAKEKNDIAKGAQLDALELLGRPVDKYLKRDALESEARKTLAKGTPKDLEWFPWSALPEIHWADTGQAVPVDVVKLLLVQAVKQKSPEPNAVLRKYCAMLAPRDREALGQFVLDAWLQEDVKPISPDAAMSQARGQAAALHQSMTKYPQHWANNPLLGKSVDEITALQYPRFARQPAGSAVGSKGLLAIAAACAAERAAPPVQRYLKEWYGTRAAQGKSLIAMLAWIEHPSAIQLMLSVGSRFRTKSFQEEATRQAEALAERKGWTLAELADRTVPSGGFDETGTLELSYGERRFTARLLPDFKVELFNPEGKKIASLPEPRQDDDAESAAAAKKTLSASKKELKGVVEMQTDRLYEALCTQRQWSYTDWATYLQRHPVLRHLVQRVVWLEMRADGNNQAFRPLDDGTLTDHEDNPVEILDGARIQVAHDSLLKPDVVAAWQQHLADYEIKPLFTQLGRGVYALPAEKAAMDRIGDFEGYLIEAFALRGRATKLGYTRGPTEDGGWFFSYEKRFPTLGLQATIEFTGNGLPEENRMVALTQLTFANADKSGTARGGGLKLAKIPATLLSECYQDLKLIAAEGKGHDPDWKKTVGW
jgi:Domain of unknown function (DUF4132)